MKNLTSVLADIRGRAVAMARGGFPDLGELVGRLLPDPLKPVALLPVAAGMAAGGKPQDLIDSAAVIVLAGVSMRAIDDLADLDNPRALHLSIGAGRAMNLAMALSAVVARELAGSPLLDAHLRSILTICQGQDRDMRREVSSLAEYKEIVKLKTVAAYELAAASGARAVTADEEVIDLCSRSGRHLGWMAQMLDDIEALWFPAPGTSAAIETRTFPVLLGLTIDHPSARELKAALREEELDRARICSLLDEMSVRTRLMSLALDQRDHAMAALGSPLKPEGSALLKLWLDWLLRGGERLVAPVAHSSAPAA
jgi:geranylgeranyl pyrophosphate synthase